MSERWTPTVAREWFAALPWLVGCNFTPSNAINQLEMWQADSFDLATIDRELGLAASVGMNAVRVYLHDLLWLDDAEGFVGRVDAFLGLAKTCAKLGLAEARIQSDPAGAKEAFLALAREKPEAIQDKEFHSFASKLGDANHLAEATEILTAGIAAFPESPNLVALRDALGDRAKASGDEGALDALKGLGYVGE